MDLSFSFLIRKGLGLALVANAIPSSFAAAQTSERVQLEDVKIQGEVHKNSVRFLPGDRFELSDQVKLRKDFRPEIGEELALLRNLPPDAPASQSANPMLKPIEGWRYLPLNPDFVNDFKDAIKKNDLNAMLEKARAIRTRSKGLPEEGEATLMLAKTCESWGLRYCTARLATLVATSHPGSMPSLDALTMLESLQRSFPMLETDLRQLLTAGSFREIPAPLIPMASYYLAIDGGAKGTLSWASAATAGLRGDDPWSLRWKYLKALEGLPRQGAEETVRRLELLKAAATAAPPLASAITWQIARLKYELGQYDDAEKLYRSLPLEGRRGGRALRERAWVHYRQKDYAQTLGLLESLRAKAFSRTSDPEQYILAMMALRDLCHYPEVKGVNKAFQERYRPAIDHVRARKNPSEQLQIGLLTTMKAQFEPWVETIELIRSERRKIESGGVQMPKDLKEELLKLYDAGEKAARLELESKVRGDLDAESARLLAIDEQVKLVDYLSGLDQFRFQQTFENRAYETERLPSDSFKVLGWPFRGEFWLDELQNYKALVTDRCSREIKK